MNAESITTWLETVGVPAEVVSVGTEADNAWCLLREEPLGEDNAVTWEVFWREQGNRYDWARFTNEQVACHYLFGRLTWAQVARGAVGVLPEPLAPAAPAAPAQPVPAPPASGQPIPPQPVLGQSAPPQPVPAPPASGQHIPPHPGLGQSAPAQAVSGQPDLAPPTPAYGAPAQAAPAQAAPQPAAPAQPTTQA